uniref:DUF4283 domain-containing protein n=1 Tax=Fagus sylvatica TaxID=28930 RepID=A0A2N9GQK4_FAGSY
MIQEVMDSDMSERPKVKFRVSGEKSGHSLEDDESVRRSTKKKKDSHLLLDSEMETDLESSMGGEKLDGKESDSPVGVRVGVSYKESLLGEIPGAYERAFFGNSMEEDGAVYSDDEDGDPPEEGEVVIKFSKELKQRIRAPWNTSLIVKVFGRLKPHTGSPDPRCWIDGVGSWPFVIFIDDVRSWPFVIFIDGVGFEAVRDVVGGIGIGMGIGGCLEGECRSGGGGGDRASGFFIFLIFVLDERDYWSFEDEESIFGGESKGIGILEVGEKPIAAAFLELGIVERSSHEGHSRSYVHESDLLPEPEFLGLEDLSADVKGGGVYPTDQQLIFLFEEILKKKNLGRGERKQIWGEEK